MKLKLALTVAAFACLGPGCSENAISEQSVERRASAFRFVGSTASVLMEAVSTRVGAWSRFAFVTPADERIGAAPR